jgi:hypothetical protein
MKQAALGFTKSQGKKPGNVRATGYDQSNLRAAREILSDVERHGGPHAFAAIWARAVLKRLGATA